MLSWASALDTARSARDDSRTRARVSSRPRGGASRSRILARVLARALERLDGDGDVAVARGVGELGRQGVRRVRPDPSSPRGGSRRHLRHRHASARRTRQRTDAHIRGAPSRERAPRAPTAHRARRHPPRSSFGVRIWARAKFLARAYARVPPFLRPLHPFRPPFPRRSPAPSPRAHPTTQDGYPRASATASSDEDDDESRVSTLNALLDARAAARRSTSSTR